MSTAMHATPAGPPQRLWGLSSWLLSHLAGYGYRVVTDRLGTPAQRTNYAILAGIEEFGPISQAALGRGLGIDRSDIVAVLNDLEREGLAVRAPDPSDRRRNAVTITPAGASNLRRLDQLVSEAQHTLLEPLSDRERRQLNELLQRLVKHHTG